MFTADRQFGGIGSTKQSSTRHWVSASTCLALTLLVKKDTDREITQKIAQRLVTDISNAFGIQAEHKWINDIVVDGRKLAGVLCSSVSTPRGPVQVLSVGLNIHLSSKNRESIRSINRIDVPTALDECCDCALQEDRVLPVVVGALLAAISSTFIPRRVFGESHHAKFYDNDDKVEAFSGVIQGVDVDGTLKVLTNLGPLKLQHITKYIVCDCNNDVKGD